MRWQITRVSGLVITLAMAAGCTSSRSVVGSTESTTPIIAVTSSTVTGTTEPTIESTPVTTIADADVPPLFNVDDLPAGAPCSLGLVPTGGQATFVAAGRLWAIDGSGALTCLADLAGHNPTWLAWSPDGDEVLVGPDTLLRADGTFSTTGYFPDNANVRWSAPTGKALIAPKVSTGELIWRNAHDSSERINITFVGATTSAAYHPAGTHIAAAGEALDGSGPGVFIASNRGANAERIGQLEPGTTAAELTFEMDGNSLVFIHRHANGSAHVHRYGFLSGQLDVLADLADESPEYLIASPVEQGDVAWWQSHSTVSGRLVLWAGGAPGPATFAQPEHTLEPIGWLPGHELLYTSRSDGTSPGTPFDLWSIAVTPGGSIARSEHLIDGVTATATRTAHGPYLPLTIVQGSGFG